MGLKSFLRGFKHAFRGIFEVFKNERNFRVQILALLWTIILVYTAEGTRAEYFAVLICSSVVLAAECMNSALERLCDRVTKKEDEFIRRAKDCAAAGVLIAAAGSGAVAVVMFLSEEFLVRFCAGISEKPYCGVLLVLIPVCAAIAAVFHKKAPDEKPED